MVDHLGRRVVCNELPLALGLSILACCKSILLGQFITAGALCAKVA